MVITSAFQAEDEGSIPSTGSKKRKKEKNMGRKIITFSTNSGDGANVDLYQVSAMDKGYNERHGYYIKVIFNSGAVKYISYGAYKNERDFDFSDASQALRNI